MPQLYLEDIQGEEKVVSDTPAKTYLEDIPDTTTQDEFITTASPLQKLIQYIQASPQRAEERIARRPSTIQELIQDPSTLGRLAQHPLGTPLRTLGGAYEYAEAIPADIGLALQRGRPQDILGDIAKTLTGQRPAQFGDIYRGAGVPEPLAATGGLLLQALPQTPTGGLGTVVAKAVSPIVSGIKYAVNKVGKPAVVGAMQFMAKIPKRFAQVAVDNPEILEPSWMAAKQVEKNTLMKTVIEPLEDNPNATVNLKTTMDNLKNLRLRLPSTEQVLTGYEDVGLATRVRGGPAPILAKVTPKQQDRIFEWLNEIKTAPNNEMQFGKVRYLLNDMDAELKTLYKQMKAGVVEPRAEAYQNIVRQVRGALRSSINENQFPEAHDALNKVTEYFSARDVNEAFKGIRGGFFRALPLTILLRSLGLPYGAAALPGYLSTIPASWKAGIRGISAGEKLLTQYPALLMPSLRAGQTQQPSDEE